MGWLGKMVGGVIGFALGGPIGAVAGSALGHTFVDKKHNIYIIDSNIYQRLSYGEEAQFNGEEAQLTFFVAVFSMLAKLAKADGRVSEKEIESIDSFIINDLHLNLQNRQSAINIFRQALNSPENFETFTMRFYNTFSNQPHLIDLIMDILFRVSVADGGITEPEERLLLNAANIFHYSPTEYARLKLKYIKDTNQFYVILQCDKTASNEEIKKKYRKLVSEYHPDKIASKGLPEDFIKFAGDKFREIQEAYDQIKKERQSNHL